MITARGYGYLILMLLDYLVLAYTGLNFLAIVWVVMVLLPVLSAIQTLFAIKMLKVTQCLEPQMLERGGIAQLSIKLEQSGFLSHGEIDLIASIPGFGKTQRVRRKTPLMARHSQQIEISITCYHRGFFKAGIMQLRSRDLFGLFYLPIKSSSSHQAAWINLSILPKTRASLVFKESASNMIDIEHHRDYKIGDEIDAVANLRAYRPGDAMKRTHWKLSARLGKTMIKEFENSVQSSGLLLLDMARTEPAKNAKACLELADNFTDRAAYLVKMILHSSRSVRLAGHKQSYLECYVERPTELVAAQLSLAGLDWSDDTSPESMLVEQTAAGRAASFVVFMSTRLNELVVSQLLALINRGIQTDLILLASDQIAPDWASALHKAEEAGLPVTLLHYTPTGKGIQ